MTYNYINKVKLYEGNYSVEAHIIKEHVHSIIFTSLFTGQQKQQRDEIIPFKKLLTAAGRQQLNRDKEFD